MIFRCNFHVGSTRLASLSLPSPKEEDHQKGTITQCGNVYGVVGGGGEVYHQGDSLVQAFWKLGSLAKVSLAKLFLGIAFPGL